ncbi:hypothetical protein Vretifemale_19313, partial [Volvox reticuliferus]
VRGLVVCEPPSRSLHAFSGGLQLEQLPSPPLRMLTRGSALPAVVQQAPLEAAERERPEAVGGGTAPGEGRIRHPPDNGPVAGCGGASNSDVVADVSVAAAAAATALPPAVPLTMDNMLLRGCMLKNSGYVLGLAVYCGPQTRIQMNAVRPPLKVSNLRSLRRTRTAQEVLFPNIVIFSFIYLFIIVFIDYCHWFQRLQ